MIPDVTPVDIYQCIFDENVEGVRIILERWGADALLVSWEEYQLPLQAAALRFFHRPHRTRRHEIFKLLAWAHVNANLWKFKIETTVFEHYSFLHCVVLLNDCEIVQAFMNQVDDLTLGLPLGQTPFYYAIENASHQVVRLFFMRGIQKMIPPNDWSAYEELATDKECLAYFVLCKAPSFDWTMCHALFEQNAKVIAEVMGVLSGSISPKDWDKLHGWALGQRKFCLLVKICSYMDADSKAKPREFIFKRYQMYAAAQHGDIQEIKCLMETGVPLSLQGGDGDEEDNGTAPDTIDLDNAPILLAIMAGHEEAAIFMLENGAFQHYWIKRESYSYERCSIAPHALAKGMYRLIVKLVEKHPIQWDSLVVCPKEVEEETFFGHMQNLLVCLEAPALRKEFSVTVANYIVRSSKRKRFNWLLNAKEFDDETVSGLISTRRIDVFCCYEGTDEASLAKPFEILVSCISQCKLIARVIARTGAGVLEPRVLTFRADPQQAAKHCKILLCTYALGLDPTLFLNAVCAGIQKDPSAVAELQNSVKAVLVGYRCFLSFASACSYTPFVDLVYKQCIASVDALGNALAFIAQQQGFDAEVQQSAKDILGTIRAFQKGDEAGQFKKPLSLRDQSAQALVAALPIGWPVNPNAGLSESAHGLCLTYGRLGAWLMVNFCQRRPTHIVELMAWFYVRLVEDEEFRAFIYQSD